MEDQELRRMEERDGDGRESKVKWVLRTGDPGVLPLILAQVE